MRTAKIIGLAFCLTLGGALTTATIARADDDTYRQLELLMDVFERIRAEYVEDVEDEEMIEAAINGMLGSLDPHSSYMSPRIYNQMQVQTRGTYGGLGLEVQMGDNGFVRVISPIDETPAARAGVQGGDFITQIDGEPVKGLTLQEAVEQMRGPVDTDLTVTLMREGVDEPFDVTITRAVITVRSVRHRVEREEIGYIRIASFNEQTSRGLRKALKTLQEELGPNLTGIVLDLRNNPGGLLDQAVGVTDMFLDRGEIVSTRGRRARDTMRWNASRGDLAEGLPVVVLVNAYSASASEIVAGALQDHKRATILGVQSFGKGTVQTVIPLGPDSAMRLTTSRYYTPSGRSIQAEGIEPDIEVEQPSIQAAGFKPRRERDLQNHFENEEDGEEQASADLVIAESAVEEDTVEEDTNADAIPDADVDTDDEQVAESSEPVNPVDHQLQYALDLLQGIPAIEQRQAAVIETENE